MPSNFFFPNTCYFLPFYPSNFFDPSKIRIKKENVAQFEIRPPTMEVERDENKGQTGENISMYTVYNYQLTIYLLIKLV